LTLARLLESIPKKKREDAIWLLLAKLGLKRSELLLGGDRELDSKFLKEWGRDWNRRLNGEPLQYIAGSAPFYGRDFFVNTDVLIPRPETESLVEIALGILPKSGPVKVVDIGTGSGAIGITLKLERPSWSVTATDISGAALAVAKRNAKYLEAPVSFVKADLFPVAWRRRRLDAVISNPPYLDFSKDRVAADVKRWEPRLALEPLNGKQVKGFDDRASWCGERILMSCSLALVGHTLLELSPRVARGLELRWRKHPRVAHIQREADLAGRKRFLLVAWKDA